MNPVKLEFWATHDYNVLFEGSHGTGKTASVKETFTKVFGEQGKDWLYFSAATMDAWVDFVGVPREVQDADGSRYLDLVRPRQLANDTVKAIFFDEYNRAPAKVRNATMELLQFKSINGKKFNNMKVIWAAINPDGDDSYDVERLDPAQKDRFDVYVKVPFDVNRSYFFDHYGKAGEEACKWWKESLDEDVRKEISPRRLETAIRMFLDGGDPSDVLPAGANIQEFILRIQDGSYIKNMHYYFSTNDVAQARESLVSENFYHSVEPEILNTNKHGTSLIAFFCPLMPNEKLAKLVTTNQVVRDWFVENQNYKDFSHIFDPIININENKAQRDANGIKTSAISKLKIWKRNSGGDDALPDVDYIDMISDSSMNINFFRTLEEQTAMMNRLTKIIDKNSSLDKVEYIKMLGPLVELYRDGRHKDAVKHAIISIKNILEKNFDENINNVMNENLPGLRQGKNSSAFQAAKKAMVEDGILDASI